MANYSGAKISGVTPGTIGSELELEPGDILLRLNNCKLLDFIDYLMLSSEERILLEILKKSGEIIEFELEKDPEEPLGLVFEELIFDKLQVCNNSCLFCFVHQLPKGQRQSLYIRDDDYRLSFLQGSYITLTNLTKADWERIEKLHLSPLYISVHATDSQVRQRLLGSRKAGNILEQIKRLVDAGITVHTQAVICPNINDGLVLERTISDLANFWPNVASLAIVPVGLTNHRQSLYNLRVFHPEEAKSVLELVNRFQGKYLNDFGTRFVFAADEWHILAGKEIPPDEEYEGYPQLDNGVGLIRWFLTEFIENFTIYLPKLQKKKLNLVLVTGQATAGVWPTIQKKFSENCPNIKLDILFVKNSFFGPLVTVTGLLAGNDINAAITGHNTVSDSVYLIPKITLKQDENLFLDGLSLKELKSACQPRVEVVPTRAKDWLEWITEQE